MKIGYAFGHYHSTAAGIESTTLITALDDTVYMVLQWPGITAFTMHQMLYRTLQHCLNNEERFAHGKQQFTNASPDLHHSTNQLLCDTLRITFALAETNTSALWVSSMSRRGAAGACFPMIRSQCVTSLSSARCTVILPLVFNREEQT